MTFTIKKTWLQSLFAFFIGVIICIVLLVCLEFTVRLIAMIKSPGTVMSDIPYTIFDNNLNFRFKPYTHVRVAKVKGTDIIYNVAYTSDKYGRRYIPTPKKNNYKKFAVFFGDSMTFGEGLQDYETMPYYLQSLESNYHVYNYAFQGYGTAHMYAKLTEPNFQKEILEKQGFVFYDYFDFHINRVIGATEMLRWNPGYAPYYYLSNANQLVRNGNFISGRPETTRLYQLFNKIQLFSFLGINLPMITNEHRKLLCEVINSSKNEVETLFPGQKFIVVVDPMSGRNDPLLKTCFNEKNIQYFDFRNLFGNLTLLEKYNNPYQIKGDGHFSKIANQIIAKALAQKIQTIELSSR